MLADDSSKHALVDLIPNQLAGENAPTGFRSFSTHVLQAFLTIERGVRIDDQSLVRRMVRIRARQLTADHRSAAVRSPARRSLRRELPRRDRVRDGRRIDDVTARRIDQKTSVGHPMERFAVDHLPRLLGQWAVKTQHVRLVHAVTPATRHVSRPRLCHTHRQ